VLEGRYLVTGASGLVGSAMLRKFANCYGVNVHAVVHKNDPSVFAKNIYYIHGDLCDYNFCNKIVKDKDYLLMLAGKRFRPVFQNNNLEEQILSYLTMNVQMLRAAYYSNIKKIIWLSSCIAYPSRRLPVTEDDMFNENPDNNRFLPGWATRTVEKMCEFYGFHAHRKKIIIVLRPTTIYGEHEISRLNDCHALWFFIKQIMENAKSIEIWENRHFNLIYVDDMIKSIILSLEKLNQFDVFNIGSLNHYAPYEILKIIIEESGHKNVKIIKKDNKYVSDNLVNCIKAKNQLGFITETPIRNGIRKLISEYKKVKK